MSSACSDCWSWVSLPDKHTQCFQALSLWLDSRWGFPLDVTAGEWQPRPEHLPTCLRLAGWFFSLQLLSDLRKKSFSFFASEHWESRLLTVSARSNHWIIPHFTLFSSSGKAALPLFTYCLKILGLIRTARYICTDTRMRMWGNRVTCKQQGEVSGTLICAVLSHWPHILHSDTLGQGDLSKLKISHRFEWGQIFSSWMLRLPVYRFGSFFHFQIHQSEEKRLFRENQQPSHTQTHRHTHTFKNRLDNYFKGFIFESLCLQTQSCILGQNYPVKSHVPVYWGQTNHSVLLGLGQKLLVCCWPPASPLFLI